MSQRVPVGACRLAAESVAVSDMLGSAHSVAAAQEQLEGTYRAKMQEALSLALSLRK